jgi:hypothetical protein
LAWVPPLCSAWAELQPVQAWERASEQAADIGVPKDDTFLYRELLKRGRSLVIATVDDPDLASAKAVFERQGSEDIDEARRRIPPAA